MKERHGTPAFRPHVHSASDHKAVTEAIHKADMACLNADIKAMQAQLDAKIAEKGSLAKQ